jgi:hypothetical protein
METSQIISVLNVIRDVKYALILEIVHALNAKKMLIT